MSNERKQEEEVDFSEDPQLMPKDVVGTLEVNLPNHDGRAPQTQTHSERRCWRTTCHLKLTKTKDELSSLIDQYPLLYGKVCLDCVQLFLDGEIFDFIIKESERYALEIRNMTLIQIDRKLCLIGIFSYRVMSVFHMKTIAGVRRFHFLLWFQST